MVGADEIMCLAAGEMEADRIADRIDQSMDFGAQPAAGAADGLVFAIFFWAPALC
jgi:hypothetical protein